MLTIIIGAIIVGLILGLLGSGGSAIMVPILVYLVGHDAKISIAESMAIVGAISLAGAIPYAKKKLINWNSVVLFGIPAMAGTFLGAWLGGLASDAVQLTVFGAVLLLSAGLMIRKAFGKEKAIEAHESGERSPVTLLRGLLIVLEGIAVGTLTGFVGVGGGFLIVPALFILGKLPMRTAIATSLVIIVMKSLVGFLKYQQYLSAHDQSVDWATIAIFIGVGVGGCFFGQQLNSQLNQRALKQAFAIFLVFVGAFRHHPRRQSDVKSQREPIECPRLRHEIQTNKKTFSRSNMNAPRPQTIENVLFERMGVSVEDAFATGADFVDEQISKAGEAGVDVEPRLSGLLGLLVQLTEPENMKALQTLIERLPRLAELAKLADEVPNLLAAFGDVFDDFQQRCESEGINLECSLVNGLHAALWLGCQIDKEDLSRIGELLKSDILSHESIVVVANAANALSAAQKKSSQGNQKSRVGLLGMLGVMRNPEVQKAIAFAAKFGEEFGRNMDSKK